MSSWVLYATNGVEGLIRLSFCRNSNDEILHQKTLGGDDDIDVCCGAVDDTVVVVFAIENRSHGD